MVYIIYKRPHVWQTPISIRTDVSDGYLYDYQSSKYVRFSLLGRISSQGGSVHARRVRRGECGSDNLHLMVQYTSIHSSPGTQPASASCGTHTQPTQPWPTTLFDLNFFLAMPNRDPIFFNHGSNNLVAGPRFEVNARGIIPRDDKIQTSYEEPLDQRAEFYALKRCPRDARGARARSV